MIRAPSTIGVLLLFAAFSGYNSPTAALVTAANSCGKAKTGATGDYISEHLAVSACGPAKTSCEAMCRASPRCMAWQWMNPDPSTRGKFRRGCNSQ